MVARVGSSASGSSRKAIRNSVAEAECAASARADEPTIRAVTRIAISPVFGAPHRNRLSADDLRGAEIAVRAVHRAAYRSRWHDPGAHRGDERRQTSRRTPCAVVHSVSSNGWRRTTSHWNASAVTGTRCRSTLMPDWSVRLSDLKSGTIDISEYIVLTDAKAVQSDPQAEVSCVGCAGLPRHHQQYCPWARGQFAVWQGSAGAQGFRAVDRSHSAHQRGVQWSVSSLSAGHPTAIAVPRCCHHRSGTSPRRKHCCTRLASRH